ncbi:hypothetical protein [Leucobacter komagatae]|nr:hypothetical protein [Leucobacter komagatae]
MLAVSGCAPGQKNVLPKISLAEARETQDAELERFRELVPYRIIEKDYGITPPRRAMSCDSILDMQPITPDSGVQLFGRWRAMTSGDEDLEPLLEKIRAEYEAKPGWTVVDTRKASEKNTFIGVTVTSPEGYLYYFDIDTEPNRENQKTISVASSSPCVEVPEDFDIDAEY